MENLQEQFINLIKNNETKAILFSKVFNALFEKANNISQLVLSKHNFQKICGLLDFNYFNQEAEDIASEAIAIAIARIQAGRFEWTGENSLLRFLTTVIKNLCYKRIKKISKNGYKISLEDKYHSISNSEVYSYEFESNQTNQVNLDIEEVITSLEKYISASSLKKVYRLSIDKKNTDEKIKDEMGYQNTGHVRKRRYEALKQIRKNANKIEVYGLVGMAA